jgi:endo-1,4-beta-D-glucanase Y
LIALDHGNARRRLLLKAMLCAPVLGLPVSLRAAPCGPWPEWNDYLKRHVQADGRVVDLATKVQQSTSESQSYGMFFALVANDRAMFERILHWMQNNLAGGALGKRLPAWRWGLADDGTWKVLDGNSASDSDLWIAYSLIEAGRLWSNRTYTALGTSLLSLVAQKEVREIAGLGRMLLPGQAGFLENGHARLNASYLPLQLLRRFTEVDPHGPWEAMAASTLNLVRASSPNGFVPDWSGWSASAYVPDAVSSGVGSYDAIRVYLWAGMLPAAEELRGPLLDAIGGPLALVRSQGSFSEKIDTARGVGFGTAPVGYAGALLPYFKALGETGLAAAQLAIIAKSGNGPRPLPYYERVLILFGKGWFEGRFSFSSAGRLQTGWEESCLNAKR